MYYMAIDLDSWEELYRSDNLKNEECLLPNILVDEHKKAKELLGCADTPWIAYNSEKLAIKNSYAERYNAYILMKLDLSDAEYARLDDDRVAFEELRFFDILGSWRKER